MSPNTEPTPKTNPRINIPTPDAMDVKDAVFPEKAARTDRHGRGRQVGAVATITGLLVAGGTGFMAYEAKHKAPDDHNTNAVGPIVPGSTESATPNAVVTPNVSPSDDPTSPVYIPKTPEATPSTPETASTPEVINQYNKLDISKFRSLDITERLKYRSYYLPQSSIEEFATEYQSGSGDPRDVYTAPSENNTPEQIVTENAYILRMGLGIQGADGYLDRDLAARLWATTSIDGYGLTNKDDEASLSSRADGIVKPKVEGMLGDFHQTDITNPQLVTSPDGKNEKCWQFTATGVSHTMCWTPYTDINGLATGAWVDYANK